MLIIEIKSVKDRYQHFNECNDLLSLIKPLQGSILGHLLFLVYTNDLSKDFRSVTKLSAYDTLYFIDDFNNIPIAKENVQKHFGSFLDRKLNFLKNIDKNIKKARRYIYIVKKLNLSSPLSSLITIYKSLIRANLHYGDIIYD